VGEEVLTSKIGTKITGASPAVSTWEVKFEKKERGGLGPKSRRGESERTGLGKGRGTLHFAKMPDLTFATGKVPLEHREQLRRIEEGPEREKGKGPV